MAYTIKGAANPIGYPAIGSYETTQKLPIGTIVEGEDPVYGQGQFMYVFFSVAIGQGRLVAYDVANKTCVTPGSANEGPIAFMPPGVASSVSATWGWIQVRGVTTATVSAGTPATGGAVYWATSGQVSATAVAGEQILDAKFVSGPNTPTTGLALVQFDFPISQGQIT